MEKSLKEIQTELDQAIADRDFWKASMILTHIEAPDYIKQSLIEGALRKANNPNQEWPGL